VLPSPDTESRFFGERVAKWRIGSLVGRSGELPPVDRPRHLGEEHDADVPAVLTNRSLDACGGYRQVGLMETLPGSGPCPQGQFDASQSQVRHAPYRSKGLVILAMGR